VKGKDHFREKNHIQREERKVFFHAEILETKSDFSQAMSSGFVFEKADIWQLSRQLEPFPALFFPKSKRLNRLRTLNRIAKIVLID
jgi:hypothetical protein